VTGPAEADLGLHHLGLTVRDVRASARWYADVLGFEPAGSFEPAGGERRKIFLRHRGLALRLGLVEHRGSPKRPFDETATGLDHLAFAVSGRPELDRWAGRLAAAGVTFSPVAPSNTIAGAWVLVFRDPDNIQLELFAPPSGQVG
jgi:glyoxylase I family protein